MKNMTILVIGIIMGWEITEGYFIAALCGFILFLCIDFLTGK